MNLAIDSAPIVFLKNFAGQIEAFCHKILIYKIIISDFDSFLVTKTTPESLMSVQLTFCPHEPSASQIVPI